jgi:hypothetical protein
VNSTGSGQGPVAGCCERGDEPSGSCTSELVQLHRYRSYRLCNGKKLKCPLFTCVFLKLNCTEIMRQVIYDGKLMNRSIFLLAIFLLFAALIPRNNSDVD